MPDWSYHPVFRPLLFRLPAETARDVTLWGMGTLAGTPWGPWVIESMGHLCPPASLRVSVAGMDVPSRVGVAPGLDVHHLALPALARLGFGFLEVGPVSLAPVTAQKPVERLVKNESIWYPERSVNDGVEALVSRLERIGPLQVPIGVRLLHQEGATAEAAAWERCWMAERLVSHVQFLTLETGDTGWTAEEWSGHVQTVRRRVRELAPEMLLFVAVPCDMAEERIRELVELAREQGIDGVIVDDGLRLQKGKLVGAESRERSLQTVRFLREVVGADVPLIAAGGVHEPGHALDLLTAGATLVQLHSGPVYWGPGLPKRINEAMAYEFEKATPPQVAESPPETTQEPLYTEVVADESAFSAKKPPSRGEAMKVFLFPSWVWALFLGLGMILSGAGAWFVAVTRVVLPYDEAFLGMSREAIQAANPWLLDFMSHDRISLAGTMISIGVLYSMLAYNALRYGSHWARDVLIVSAGVGFASFFLYLGFGYFDKLHALLSLTLLPCFLFGLRREGRAEKLVPVNLVNDRDWLRAQWGQMLFVGIGGALTVAGLTISIIGMTHVFVHEDLEFMQTTADVLQAANPNLIPLIAHDRAGFGGALVSDGLAVLLTALWGFRQGARWVWWTLLGAGVPGFTAGLGIHFLVGYVDFWHLFPAFVAALLFLVALLLSYRYLNSSNLPV